MMAAAHFGCTLSLTPTAGLVGELRALDLRGRCRGFSITPAARLNINSELLRTARSLGGFLHPATMRMAVLVGLLTAAGIVGRCSLPDAARLAVRSCGLPRSARSWDLLATTRLAMPSCGLLVAARLPRRQGLPAATWLAIRNYRLLIAARLPWSPGLPATTRLAGKCGRRAAARQVGTFGLQAAPGLPSAARLAECLASGRLHGSLELPGAAASPAGSTDLRMARSLLGSFPSAVRREPGFGFRGRPAWAHFPLRAARLAWSGGVFAPGGSSRRLRLVVSAFPH
mmetsp:Transcript_125704/g.367256  ORF Transcript_125704/g.367256 Transcript_125704/m.367256 type:complete len:285 (+) Transcript_125704:674-1528(+)